MLYDYKMGRLDPLRHQAVEEGLASSPKVREELKKLTIGISYCDKLKNISVSEPLMDLILDQPKPAKKIFSKLRWGNFPQPVRWAFEAVVVAVAIALFVTQVPELFKGESSESKSVVVKKFDIKPSEPQATVKAEVVEKKPQPIIASKEIPPLLRPPTPEPPSPTTPTTVAVGALDTTPAATITKPIEAKPIKKGNAYVYRMTMYVDDVDTVTPEIVNLISGLGGEKAGEVELGWRRKSGSYFHFSVPQDNSPALQEGLKKYANFNIIKSVHPRVMPEGVERYILWVEKKNAGDASAGETTEESTESENPMEESATIPTVGPKQPQKPISPD